MQVNIEFFKEKKAAFEISLSDSPGKVASNDFFVLITSITRHGPSFQSVSSVDLK